MADISYFEAWVMWLDGRSTVGNDLFGVPMIWWGRAGKIAAFAGGLTVVLDLAGPDRIAAASRRIKSALESLMGALIGYVPTGILVLIVLALNAWADEPLVDWLPDVPVGGGVLDLVVSIVFVAVIMSVTLGGSWLVIVGMLALMRRAARLLSDPRMLVLRVSAVLAICIGFHFDLLAS
ncbi:hypothetical protein AB0K40_09335 [Nonomuraea bangladeshensis]|uniref:Yip1 domain-containing protein n=1 Tax=Nonomuraea bangladeshensis TaxID=404385 RepID=A0ABV3GZJ5_9ACTN